MSSGLKSKIQASISNKKINVFLFFFSLSFVILLLSKLSDTYTNTIVFGVENINLPEEHVVIKNPKHQLNITLKANGFRLLKYYFKKPLISIDFSKSITKTDSLYIWNKSSAFSNINVQFDKAVEIKSINPDTLYFRYDINAVKYVPVKLNTNIKYSSGFDVLGLYSISPDSIKITGPNVLVSKINIIETDTLVLTQVNANVSEMVSLQLSNTNDELKFSDSKIKLKATIVKFTEGTLQVPISVINVPDSLQINFFPKKINVSYYTSLENFSNIKANNFQVICDYSKIGNKQSHLIPELIKTPKSVKNVKINQQQIGFIITE